MNELCDHCQAFHFKAKSISGYYISFCHNSLFYFLVYLLGPQVVDELQQLM
jgi:hypothetical protein